MNEQKRERGQSLLEIAIILPVLLLLLLGVAEVGMGLRSYLIVGNANREAARYGAQGRVNTTDTDIAQILLDAGGTVPWNNHGVPFMRTRLTENPDNPGNLIDVNEVPPNTGIIITHVVFPREYDHSVAWQNFVISDALQTVTGVISVESGEVVPPDLQIMGRDDIRWMDDTDSHIDLSAIVNRHGQASSDINDNRVAAHLARMDNHIIIVETFYLHQPLGKGLVPSPWIMYAQMEVRDASG